MFKQDSPILPPIRSVGPMNTGGGGEIRTLGGLSPSLVFKTSAFNRSATPPEAGMLHNNLPKLNRHQKASMAFNR